MKERVELSGTSPGDETATIVAISRRYAWALTPKHERIKAKLPSKIEALAPGDRVTLSSSKGDPLIAEVKPRKNILARKYGDKTKEIAANLDMLYIVTAVEPLFQTLSIDRVLSVAHANQIPCTLVLNKMDLGSDDTPLLLQPYQILGLPIIAASALNDEGLRYLREAFTDRSLEIVALVGISGVGKSTILNKFVPDAEERTSEVSVKTGLGRQTTTQARGHVYQREDNEPLLIIDLPGIQSFGITQLTKAEVRDSFEDFREFSSGCEYDDCFHLFEPKCGVKEALEAGNLAPSRFESYVSMIAEVEAARKY